MRMSPRSDDGQSMVEYSLLLALIAVAAIVVLRAIGVDVDAAFEQVHAAIDPDAAADGGGGDGGGGGGGNGGGNNGSGCGNGGGVSANPGGGC